MAPKRCWYDGQILLLPVLRVFHPDADSVASDTHHTATLPSIAKRCARKLDIINDTVESVKYSAESAITRYLSDSVPDKMHGLISEMVEKHFRENVLPCELRPEDVEFGSPYKEPEIFPKESFDINDFPTMEPELQEKLRPAIETIVFEEGYADKYINRPSFNLNGIGMKRVALSPEHWTKLVSLGFVNEE